MSNQGEYHDDGQPHDFSLSRRDLIKASAAAAATAAVYPCSALAEGEPATIAADERVRAAYLGTEAPQPA